MGLFYNNGVAGSGVSKTAGQKKPFFRFWELFFSKFWKFFQINLIYFVFCLPVVTIGPATAAMTAIMRNFYLERPQFIFHDFKQEFKKNFKQALPIGLLDVGAIALGVFAILYYSNTNRPEMDTTTTVLYVLCLVGVALVMMMSFYIYPQIVALDLKLGQIVRNSLLLIFLNPVGTIITFACFFGYAALIWFFWLFVVFLTPIVPFAWLSFISFFCCYPTIQKVLINPYYEKTGEKNPEIPDYVEDNVFTDLGGKEEPLNLKDKDKGGNQRGKIIK
ncbi:MAG: YesL family protein [Oscillospiraceae bacterium]